VIHCICFRNVDKIVLQLVFYFVFTSSGFDSFLDLFTVHPYILLLEDGKVVLNVVSLGEQIIPASIFGFFEQLTLHTRIFAQVLTLNKSSIQVVNNARNFILDSFTNCRDQ
jgi:hypothetical protein